MGFQSYRVLQEGISKLPSYMGASEIQVSILQKKGGLTLQITGHERLIESKITRKRTFQLRKRAQEVGGKLTINSGSREWNKR